MMKRKSSRNNMPDTPDQQFQKVLNDPLAEKLRNKYPSLLILIVHKDMTVEEILKHIK